MGNKSNKIQNLLNITKEHALIAIQKIVGDKEIDFKRQIVIEPIDDQFNIYISGIIGDNAIINNEYSNTTETPLVEIETPFLIAVLEELEAGRFHSY